MIQPLSHPSHVISPAFTYWFRPQPQAFGTQPFSTETRLSVF